MTNDTTFSEVAEDMHAGAAEYEDFALMAEVGLEEMARNSTGLFEGMEEMKEARDEARARREAGFTNE
jgi:hypothetical protein